MVGASGDLHDVVGAKQVSFAALATLMIVVLYNDVISNVLRVRNG